MNPYQVPGILSPLHTAAQEALHTWEGSTITHDVPSIEDMVAKYAGLAYPSRIIQLIAVAEDAERLERVLVNEEVPYSEKEPLVRALRESLDALGRDWGIR